MNLMNLNLIQFYCATVKHRMHVLFEKARPPRGDFDREVFRQVAPFAYAVMREEEYEVGTSSHKLGNQAFSFTSLATGKRYKHYRILRLGPKTLVYWRSPCFREDGEPYKAEVPSWLSTELRRRVNRLHPALPPPWRKWVQAHEELMRIAEMWTNAARYFMNTYPTPASLNAAVPVLFEDLAQVAAYVLDDPWERVKKIDNGSFNWTRPIRRAFEEVVEYARMGRRAKPPVLSETGLRHMESMHVAMPLMATVEFRGDDPVFFMEE
jgi:hypothetical protein